LSFFSADILTIISNQKTKKKKKKKVTDIKCSRSSLMMHTAVQADLGGSSRLGRRRRLILGRRNGGVRGIFDLLVGRNA